MFCRSYEWNPKLIVVEGKLNPVTRLLPGSVIGTDTEVVMAKVEDTCLMTRAYNFVLSMLWS